MIHLLLALAIVTAAQFDQAGRKAYGALRDFTRLELLAFHQQKPWPDAEQHKQLAAKLPIAYETIQDSLVYGAGIAAGQPMPSQLASMLRQQETIVWSLAEQVGPRAPKEIRSALVKVQDAIAALLALFPPVADLDHPPAKR